MSVLRLNRDKSNQMLYNDNVPVSEMSSIKRNQKSPSRTALDNKLQQLEKKQYELTKKVILKILIRNYSHFDFNMLNFNLNSN